MKTARFEADVSCYTCWSWGQSSNSKICASLSADNVWGCLITCCSYGCPCYWHLVLQVGNPPLHGPVQSQSPARSLSLPPSLPPLLVWYSERGVCSLAISLLFIMAQTYEERWIPYPACVSVCPWVCLRVCALVWGRSTCSVVSTEQPAELATLLRAGWGHSTSSVNTSPERMRASPFWAPRNRWERGVNSNEHYTHSVTTQTWGLDVRNGRFVQSPEVGLRLFILVLSRAFIACCASGWVVLFSRVAVQLSDKTVWCLLCVRAAVIMCTGCVCVDKHEEEHAHCVGCCRSEHAFCHCGSHTVTRLCDNNVTAALSLSHKPLIQCSHVRGIGFPSILETKADEYAPSMPGRPGEAALAPFCRSCLQPGWHGVWSGAELHSKVHPALRPAMMCAHRSPWHLITTSRGLFLLCCNYVSVPQTSAVIGWNWWRGRGYHWLPTHKVDQPVTLLFGFNE